MSSGPKFSTKPSLVRSVKVRASCPSSSLRAGRRTSLPSCTSWATRSRSSIARGVGTRPRPARTSSGSPVVSRRRASARLIAEGLSCSARGARHAAFGKQHIEREQQVQVGRGHGGTIAAFAHTWRQTHE
jgi:hypothetical protein